jgi:hypothetical protein
MTELKRPIRSDKAPTPILPTADVLYVVDRALAWLLRFLPAAIAHVDLRIHHSNKVEE